MEICPLTFAAFTGVDVTSGKTGRLAAPSDFARANFWSVGTTSTNVRLTTTSPQQSAPIAMVQKLRSKSN
jgi:hypothetical protein